MRSNRLVLVASGLLWFGAALGEAAGPRILEKKPPAYPAAEEAARHGGRVVLRVNVKADGIVEAVDVTSGTGYPALDQAAVDAVRAWRFVPATDEKGNAVAGAATFALTFTPPARDLDPEASCGQLNTEVAELRARSPEASLDQVPLLGPYKDMAEATDAALPASMRGAILAELPQVLERVVAACAAQPEEKLYSKYLAAISPDEPRKKRKKN